jgi:uncharacterized protein (TIGR04255 family)
LSELPDYERPPVVEVVLGLRFEPLPIRALDLGALNAVWAQDYPQVSEQPVIPPPPPVGVNMQMPMITFGVPPMQRHWWTTVDASRLLQVQQDRLILNWRRTSPETDYPRYPALRATFVRHLEEFQEFAARFGPLQVTHFEVTYINDLPALGTRLPLGEAFENWTATSGHHLGEPEEVRFAAVYQVGDVDAEAKLFASLDPGAQPFGTSPTTLFTLTVRGQLNRSLPPAEALQYLDIGRSHIVRSFTELTTASMHTLWGLK